MLRRLSRRVGRRGDSLIFFAIVDFGYALSLLSPVAEAKRSPTVKFIAYVMPLPVWGVLWLAVGMACLVAAFVTRDRWAFVAAVSLKVLWGGTFLAGWLIAGLDRGWLSALIWLAMARFAYRIGGWAENVDVPLLTRAQVAALIADKSP